MAEKPDTFTESELQAERWLAVPGYEGAYEVSDLGRVRSLSRVIVVRTRHGGIARRRLSGTTLKASVMKDGHLVLALGRAGRALVHTLVLHAFVGARPAGREACHGDGRPSNNRLGNLRWGTRSDNVRDAVRHGTHRGWAAARRPAQILDATDIPSIRSSIAAGERYSDIGRRHGVSGGAIGAIARGQNWSHVQQETTT